MSGKRADTYKCTNAVSGKRADTRVQNVVAPGNYLEHYISTLFAPGNYLEQIGKKEFKYNIETPCQVNKVYCFLYTVHDRVFT